MTEEDFAQIKLDDELLLSKEQRRGREYYQENREKCLAYVEEYYKAHKEERKKYKAEWYQANRDRIRAQQTDYYTANKQRIDERTKSELYKVEIRCRGRLKRRGLKLEKKRSGVGLSCDPDFCLYRISAGDQSGSDYTLSIKEVMQAAGIT